eukprot:COSAG01_NODE_44740_length_416_cov_0.649842_2_plen_25_part_01
MAPAPGLAGGGAEREGCRAMLCAAL